MRPPFLRLGGAENFSLYQSEFDKLLPNGLKDILGNSVIFPSDSCHHICYKPEDIWNDSGKKWNQGPRDQWIQERAERIPLIREALTRPKFIRISVGKIWAYLLEVPADHANDPELFVVIVNADKVTRERQGTVYFMTGYTIGFRQWEEFKKHRPWIYPPDVPKPLKPKKKKGNAG